MKRQAFLDWSGDLGFKFERSSSRHLVFVLIVCDDYTRLREGVRQFRRQRHVSDDFELHYNQSSEKLRRAFFEWLVEHLPLIAVAALTVNKPHLPEDFRRAGETSNLCEFVAQLVSPVSQPLKGAYLLIDGERKHLVELRRRIRKTLSDVGYHLYGVQMRDSRLEDGIQIADMIAGALMDQLEDKSRLFDLIRGEVEVQEFVMQAKK